ncbi:MAG: hypothetical protein R3291_05605, partial [Thermoplasmata archaeon]|nr:hypothetical protein [Thermoplasmata archaeon]
ALLEPQAPPIPARLRCLRELANQGLVTLIGFAPAYPLTGGWTPAKVADALAAAGVQKAFSRTLDARWGVREATLGRLAGSPLRKELLRISDLAYMRGLIAEVAEECEARGIAFRRERPRPSKDAPAAPRPVTLNDFQGLSTSDHPATQGLEAS